MNLGFSSMMQHFYNFGSQLKVLLERLYKCMYQGLTALNQWLTEWVVVECWVCFQAIIQDYANPLAFRFGVQWRFLIFQI